MLIQFNYKIFIRDLTTWVVILSCFGYPLTLSIGILLNADIGLYNTIIRIMIAFACFIIIFYNIKNHKIKVDIVLVLFLTFWVLYTIRLIYDQEFKGIRYLTESPIYIYMFAIGGIFIPCFAILSSDSFETSKIFIKRVFNVLIISNILMLLILLLDSKNILNLILTRSEIFSETSNGRIRVLNGITYSMQGSYLLVTYISKLLFFPEKPNRLKVILILTVALCNMIIGASRGPLLTSFITVLVLLFLYGKNNGIKVIKPLFIIVLLMSLLLLIISSFVNLKDISIISRFITTYDYKGGHKFEYRNDEWRSAVVQFLDNPIFGDQFVVKYDNAYPHNLFLEVAMSLGITGLFIFVSYIHYLFYIVYSSKQYTYTYGILALLLTTILSYQLSGSLFTGISFWVLTLFYIKSTLFNQYRVE